MEKYLPENEYMEPEIKLFDEASYLKRCVTLKDFKNGVMTKYPSICYRLKF